MSDNTYVECNETELVGEISIEDLLQSSFEKHIGSFEIPSSLKTLFSIDEVNAIITWYLHWKLTSPPNTQNTCYIKELFGYNDGMKVIIAINLYKYLRTKEYDPYIIEKFISN